MGTETAWNERRHGELTNNDVERSEMSGNPKFILLCINRNMFFLCFSCFEEEEMMVRNRK
jgi:hypothetical protein